MLWNAATVLPLSGSDGNTAIDTLEPNLPVALTASVLAWCFAVRKWKGLSRSTCPRRIELQTQISVLS